MIPRFHRFIYETKPLPGKRPVVNRIPCEVTWRHDLAHKLPCEGQNPRVLAVVVSAPGHQALRDRIRKSWASPALYPRSGLRYGSPAASVTAALPCATPLPLLFLFTPSLIL